MSYWTMMVITILSGPLDGIQTGILYPSEAACLQSIRSVTDTLDYDFKVECETSTIVSDTIKPRRRP